MKLMMLVAVMILGLARVNGEVSLNFCARVDQNGYCLFNNNRFFLAPDSNSARIYLEVNQPQTFSGTSKITFKFFSVANNGDEKYFDVAEQNVQNDWVYAWVPHQFNVGKYNIKVYNDKNELLVSRSFELFN